MKELEVALGYYYEKGFRKSNSQNYLAKSLESKSINAVVAEAFFVAMMTVLKNDDTMACQASIVTNFRYFTKKDMLMKPFESRTTDVNNIISRSKIMEEVITDTNFTKRIEVNSSEESSI